MAANHIYCRGCKRHMPRSKSVLLQVADEEYGRVRICQECNERHRLKLDRFLHGQVGELLNFLAELQETK